MLNAGLYPNPSAFPNDTISSVVVGSAVNLLAYKDSNYGGDVAFYSSGSFASLGQDANDSFSSLKILSNYGDTVSWFYLGNSLQDFASFWTSEIQGLAHDASYWYITTKTGVYKFDLDADLHSASPVAQADLASMPGLASMNCQHLGDPELLYANGTEYLLIPVEQCNFPAGYPARSVALAVVDPNSLTLIAYDSLEYQDNGAWVSITTDPSTGQPYLYSSNGNVDGSNPLLTYTIDTSALTFDPYNPHYIAFDGPNGSVFYLYREDGTPVSMNTMQGGVFSSDHRVLYLNNGYDDCNGGADGGTLRAFDAATGVRIFSMSNTYGFDQYEYHCGLGGSGSYQEPEGLDFGGVNGWGSLHAFMYGNVDSALYFKHYDSSLGVYQF